jgi:hypothetical protein
MRGTHARGLALIATLALLGGAASARADDRVSVTPDLAETTASDATGYTITLEGDAPASAIRFLLPSHGQPCGYGEELGDPYIGSDPDTNWVVTDPAGGLVTGRWITWVGSFVPPFSIHISVVTPPLGGCFYAGATATAPTRVTGLRKGAQVFNGQDPLFGTRGAYSAAGDRDLSVTLWWTMWNGTDEPVVVLRERLGTPDERWGVASYTLAGAPHVGRGKLYTWSEQLVLPAHGELVERVRLTRPCGVARKSLRLRITRSDGLTAGTGDGVPIPLAAC